MIVSNAQDTLDPDELTLVLVTCLLATVRPTSESGDVESQLC